MNTAENPHHEQRWLVLVVIGLAQLMVVLDATIVNIALPSAQHALGFSNDSRQWVVTAYALSFGGLLLLGGRLGDLFGRKRVFIVGLIGFAGASAVGGFAQSFAVLVGARALQGGFAALLAPAALSLLSTTFEDAKERATAFGVYGAIAGSGAAAGLLLGGVLTEYLSWRWCLYVNLAFAVPTALAAIRLLRHEASVDKPRLDIPGALTSSLGLFAIVYGFAEAETKGWGAPITLGSLIAGVILLVGFVVTERRVSHPLLPLRVVLDRARGGSLLAIGTVGIGMFGVFLFLTYYLQNSLGFSPVRTGLAFLPMMGILMIAATLGTSKLVPRFGPRPLVSLGLLIAGAGSALLTRITIDSSYDTHVLPALLLLGLGLGLTMAPAISSATAGVRSEDAGVASAMVSVGQQVGGSIGTALLSSFAATATASFITTHSHTPQLAAHAAVHGYTTAFWWSAGIFAIGAIVCGLLLPTRDAAVEAHTDETEAQERQPAETEEVVAREPAFAH
jgi:EmrB/QacA subfamily drug resistance transporter